MRPRRRRVFDLALTKAEPWDDAAEKQGPLAQPIERVDDLAVEQTKIGRTGSNLEIRSVTRYRSKSGIGTCG